ncbi:MAG: Crp/Fnr family transcriptional regulator [Bacteroidales bacterium]|nr:Crp/Fnr family transcriptional regulator [Bacteroidales bacterium]
MDPGCTCESCELRELFIQNLDDEHAEIVCTSKIEKEFRQGEVIIKEGTLIQEFTYLKSGLVKLFRSDQSGREQIITIARPMDYVSLLSVFSDQHYNYSVSALEDSVTCNLKMDEIRTLASENGKLALNLLKKMSEIADTIILESLEIRKKHLRGRVAYLLIYFSRTIFYSEEFDLPLTRKEMADYVGMTTENVIRTLSEFRRDGILKIYGKTIQIANMDSLQSIAEFG